MHLTVFALAHDGHVDKANDPCPVVCLLTSLSIPSAPPSLWSQSPRRVEDAQAVKTARRTRLATLMPTRGRCRLAEPGTVSWVPRCPGDTAQPPSDFITIVPACCLSSTASQPSLRSSSGQGKRKLTRFVTFLFSKRKDLSKKEIAVQAEGRAVRSEEEPEGEMGGDSLVSLKGIRIGPLEGFCLKGEKDLPPCLISFL